MGDSDVVRSNGVKSLGSPTATKDAVNVDPDDKKPAIPNHFLDD
jgi:hypothetical protein